MKAVLLAGGLGTRISEESALRPKPMIEVGGRPVLWHIMKMYSRHGINDFVVCLGYKGYIIKEYFANYFLHSSNITIETKPGKIEYHESTAEDWRITLVDTGEDTMTGGRLRRIRHLLNEGEPFFMTYGDGLSDVDLHALLAFHRAKGRPATVTSVVEPGRFGDLQITNGAVERFTEKPTEGRQINGGFFVLDPSVLDLVTQDSTIWEREPLEHLASTDNLAAFEHRGFWQPMDTLRDRMLLEDLYERNAAPWKVWT